MRRTSLYVGLLVILLFVPLRDVYAQANKTNSGDFACPASGTSGQIIAQRSGRYSYSINNVSGLDVRIGYLGSGTANLTTSNSWLLKAGQPYSDSAPGLLTNRVVCMSTSAATATISFNETYR